MSTERGGRKLQSGSTESRDTFTRPANTDAYGATDVISATVSDTATTPLRSLDLALYPGKAFWLVYLRLETNLDTFAGTARVHFYTVAAPDTAVPGDNVAFVRAYANTEDYIGYVDLPAFTDVGDEMEAFRDDVRLLCQPAGDGASETADSKIYYRIALTAGTPTPASGQSFTIEARAVDA